MTNKTHSPQLHTERTIFSHIAYLNNVRLYFLDCNVTKDLEYQKEYNKVFVEFIRRYIDLYINKIQPLTSKRSTIAMKLKSIVDKIQEAINTDNNDKNVLFQSISLG